MEYVLTESADAKENLRDSSMYHRIILKDGTIKHICSIAKFQLDQNGQPIGIYGISHDVTELKIAERKLKINEANLNEAQAIAHMGSWELDMEQYTNKWSDEFYNIYQINKNEVRPSAELFLSFMHPDDFEYGQKKVREAFDTLNNGAFYYRFIRTDGKIRYGYCEWKFDFDKNNKPTRIYGIVQDITERKLAEEEREKMVAHILQRNKDLEQFAYIVSHNLRAPVVNIIGMTDVLNNIVIEEGEKEIITQNLSISAKKLDDVIKDLNHILQIKHEVNEKMETVRFHNLFSDIKLSIEN